MKIADAHHNPKAMTPLTRLEEKVIAAYGMDYMDGNQNVGEAGFQYRMVAIHFASLLSIWNLLRFLIDPVQIGLIVLGDHS